MESTTVRVVRVEPRTPPARKPGYGGFHYGVSYVLEDGRALEYDRSRRLMRDAKAEYASLPKEVTNTEVSPTGLAKERRAHPFRRVQCGKAGLQPPAKSTAKGFVWQY